MIMDINRVKHYFSFTHRLMISHFLSYFIIGIIFFSLGLNATGYYERHPIDLVTALHRESNSIWVMAGPLFQLIRALLFSLVLYPIKEVFLEKKHGWLFLWLILMVFAIFAPAGEAPGSIEGVVYTKLPLLFHALYFPELLIQTLLFSWLFLLWEKGKLKKVLTVPLTIIFFLLILAVTIGVVQKL